MKKVIFRLFAYVIDSFIVSLLVVGLSSISYLNPNKDKMNQLTNNYIVQSNQYRKLNDNIDGYLSDNFLSQEEKNEIQDNCNNYYDILNQIDSNEELSDEKKNNAKDSIRNLYDDYSFSYIYNSNKLYVPVYIETIIVSFLYFGLFEYLMKGQTLGKKISRLRTIDNKDEKKDISLFKYLIKAVLVGNILFNSLNIISVIVFKDISSAASLYSYYKIYSGISNFSYVYNMLFLLMIFMRRDERSIHDILLGIRVALYDKENKEITNKIFNEEVNNKAN